MPDVKKRNILHVKLIFIVAFATFIPIAASSFIALNPIMYWGVGIISLCVATALLFWAISPLSQLIKGFENLAGGNLNQRVDIRSADEFEDVANSFNMMAGNIAGLVQKIEKDGMLVSGEKNQLDAILSSIVDGIIALDFSRNIILVNKATEYMAGYTQQELQGKPIDQFIRFYDNGEEIFAKNVCQANFNQPATLVGKNGKQTKVNITAGSILEGVQTNLGCILILHDLSKEEELEQMKLDFVSMASHELKTPLTSIIGYLSVFINENTDKIEKEELELLQKSLVSSKNLYSLVSNLLSVNKIEREQLSVFSGPVDYGPILQKTVDDLQNQAKLKNITLTLKIPEGSIPKITADPIRITEVIDNLVANAINYTNSGGQVTVWVQASPTEVTTSIVDTGVGIPKDAIPHLFTKFFRVSNTTQQASKGTGLGLYISKSIIEKLNGKIWVESEMGKGSKFAFSLPTASQSNVALDTSKFVSGAIASGNLNY